MPAITPSATTWTLRLKHAKTTVVLHVDPQQTLGSVRAELLHCLRETCPDGVPCTVSAPPGGNEKKKALPADAAALQLAKMRDPSDPERGWVALLVDDAVAAAGGGDEEEEEEGEKKGKGKGRARERARARGAAGLRLKEVGVKDGAVLAFRWGGGEEKARVGAEMEVDLDGEEGGDDGAWDVVLPKYEDSYMDGLEDEGIVE
ncbi:uncharacterized protein BKCO1_10000143 [Diplodia corticola]|uniref:Uncharacterized protein n=1 Tax=Diplodia corticola TaxID=236234 RepID=A0A1J9SAN0_9PEZI|nr:uncharacterized protein BKCO1_10000143 [Diplodia corticola]OJD36637.1 hypothetical protein BKCO1_10000143 [Diplodia corticola]